MLTPDNDSVVLVVEDETTVRSFCCTVLRRHGFSSVDAATPAAAIELVKMQYPVSVILTDMAMPGMNGTEAPLWSLAERSSATANSYENAPVARFPRSW